MKQKYGPIETTPRDDSTYNSSTLYSFTWRRREGSEEFDKGQLIVKFRDNPDHRDQMPSGPPSSAYAYNVPKDVFEELKHRAHNIGPNDPGRTAGEWFNNKLIDYIEFDDRKDGNLYKSKLKL